jgi:hypothetical protein
LPPRATFAAVTSCLILAGIGIHVFVSLLRR